MQIPLPLPWEQTDARQPTSVRIAVAAATATAQAIVTRASKRGRLLATWGPMRLMPTKGAIATMVTPQERRDRPAFAMQFEIAAAGRSPRNGDALAEGERREDDPHVAALLRRHIGDGAVDAADPQ